MFNNIRRAILSLIGVTLAFGVYTLLVVPFVDRKPENSSTANSEITNASSTTKLAATATNRFVRELSNLGFPPGSWELEKPTVLRTPQFTILLKDIDQLPNGSLQVKPCTLVFYSEGREASHAKRGPTIMQAPEGAILAFDRKIDLQKFKLDGKVTGGRLVGDIRIFSAGGPDNDDLEIVTSDVQIFDQRIFTRNRVSFRVGNSYYGTGRDLTLTRDAPLFSAKRNPQRAPVQDAGRDKSNDKDWMSELAHIQLEHLEVLNVRMDADKLFQSLSNRSTSERATQVASAEGQRQPKEANTPATVKVRCKGPLHFDLRRMISTLEKDVTVTHQVPNQPTDTLWAEQLSLHLTRTKKKRPPGEELRAPNVEVPDFTLERIMGFGRPMVIQAASQQAYVETRHLEYNFETNRVKLRSFNPFAPETADPSEFVIVQNADHKIAAPAIDYLGSNDLAKSQLVAQGRGQYVGKLEIEPEKSAVSNANSPAKPQSITATWSERLSLQPFQDQQVLKVEGDATVQAPDFGQIASDNLDLWLKFVPVATRRDGTVIRQAMPVRLTSYSNQGRPTQIRSPQITGTLQSMTVHFLDSDSPAKESGPNVGGSVFGRKPTAAQSQTLLGSTAEGKLQKSFRIRGGIVEAWVDVNAQQVRRLVAQGETRLVESNPTDEVPLEISGSMVDFQTDAQGKPIVRLMGTPAELKSPKLELTGNDIQLIGNENRIVVPGSGKLLLTYDPASLSGIAMGNDVLEAQPIPDGDPRFGAAPISRSFANPAARAQDSQTPTGELQKMEIQWSDQLTFDGQTAVLMGEVTAFGEDIAVQTNDLEVVFLESIDFSKLQSSVDMPQLARIATNSPLLAGNRQRDDLGNITSYQQLVTQNLRLDLQSGELLADGPGWVVLTTTPDKIPALLNSSADNTPQTGLRQLSLNFAQQIRGNTTRRELQMYDNIQGWLGPVDKWEERIDPNAIQELGEGQFRLSCNLLSVYESPTAAPIDPKDPKSRKPFELIADHGAHVESQLYFARGNQITFAEEKGLLTMRGSEQRLAEFWQRNSPTERGTMSAKARTVQYNVNTGNMDARISDVEIDLSSVQKSRRN